MFSKDCNLTQDLVKHYFNYDPETGIFIRKITTAKSSKIGEIAGGKDQKGYIRIRILNKKYRAHKLAWLYMYGNYPEQIDHINGIKDDNRISNLRLADNFINSQNKRKLLKSNKSGYMGVHFDNNIKMFRARIGHKGKNICLGFYDDPKVAGEAYLKAKRELHAGCTI